MAPDDERVHVVAGEGTLAVCGTLIYRFLTTADGPPCPECDQEA